MQGEDEGSSWGQLGGLRLKVLGEGREWVTTCHGTFAWAFGKLGLGRFSVVQTAYLRLGAQQRSLFYRSGG